MKRIKGNDKARKGDMNCCGWWVILHFEMLDGMNGQRKPYWEGKVTFD